MKIEADAAADAPPGYRWVSRLWRRNPDGTRDYAAFHGKSAFRALLPVSSKLRSYTLFDLFSRREEAAKPVIQEATVQGLPVSPTHG